MTLFSFLRLNYFLLLLILTVIIATLFPYGNDDKTFFNYITIMAVTILFFMHGAKLSPQTIIAGLRQWRLHSVIFTATFVLFPLLGLSLQIFVPTLLSEPIYLGFLYLCALPATMQSAIAFTSIAKGNVAAAICSASASTLIGVFLTPILVGLLIHIKTSQTDTLNMIIAILLKLILPFILGHLSHPIIANWIASHQHLVNKIDYLSVLLVVYVVFSDTVNNNIWHRVSGWSLFSIVLFSLLLLTVVLVIMTYVSRRLSFNKADRITIIFCGSKKSLASGIPMANVLFPASMVGIMILPLMIFHQLQIIICAVIASYYAKQSEKIMIKN